MSNIARNKNISLSGPVFVKAAPLSSISDHELNEMLGIPGVITSQRMVLEPRLLLDAAGVETADTFADQIAIEHAENWQTPVAQDEITAIVRAISEADELQANADISANQIVFIDSSVKDIDTLLVNIDPTIEVVIIDANSDGVDQIAKTLEGRTDVEAIHIISHGGPGTLDLGNTSLTQDSINGEHADELAIIRSALSQDADILIYGCDFAANNYGKNAVQALAAATGADIAASNDLTGAVRLGGDWDLEIEKGEVETEVAISQTAQAAFASVLVDTDSDGIDDEIDVDDYNDGILDIEEGYVEPPAAPGTYGEDADSTFDVAPDG